MYVTLRPAVTSGIALIGASAIALTPVSPIPTPSRLDLAAAQTVSRVAAVDLAALELPYILTLPVVRQSLRNWAANWAVYLAGLGKAGVGVVQSVAAIPEVTVAIVRQALALDFIGAFNTFALAVRDAVVAVGEPLLESVIWRNQKADLVNAALQAAVPKAWIDVANGFLAAGNGVVTSLIEGSQNLVAAFLTLNLGNIVDAALEGTKDFFASLGDGARLIVEGIEAAQLGIATALATNPPPSPFEDPAPNVSPSATFAARSAPDAAGVPEVDASLVTLGSVPRSAAGLPQGTPTADSTTPDSATADSTTSDTMTSSSAGAVIDPSLPSDATHDVVPSSGTEPVEPSDVDGLSEPPVAPKNATPEKPNGTSNATTTGSQGTTAPQGSTAAQSTDADEPSNDASPGAGDGGHPSKAGDTQKDAKDTKDTSDSSDAT